MIDNTVDVNKLCKNCKYCGIYLWQRMLGMWHIAYCTRTRQETKKISLVSGITEHSLDITLCNTERNFRYKEYCGKDAKFFIKNKRLNNVK